MIGTVSWRLYWRYFRAGLSVPGIIALVALIILAQGKQGLANKANSFYEPKRPIGVGVYLRFL